MRGRWDKLRGGNCSTLSPREKRKRVFLALRGQNSNFTAQHQLPHRERSQWRHEGRADANQGRAHEDNPGHLASA